ncbi:MAG: YjbE family putative metal transport protein [Pseudomonadota bacterium]|nr:YjbE family putative metal transport protein [Pseudomonadota bacterium]
MSFLPELIIFSQIVVIDVSLAGDNAIAIGMAASGLAAEHRHRAIVRGIIIAALLRVLFAIFAVKLLHVVGLLVIGGLLLLWVSWKMYEEIRRVQLVLAKKAGKIAATAAEPLLPHKQLSAAILQIAIADISMSLDNVLAVAGVARDHLIALIFGLTLSVILMGLAAAVVARIITRHRWVAWAGLLMVLYTALKMIWDGSQDIVLALR